MYIKKEYPRPQFKREKWVNLNGEWDFEYDDCNRGLTEKWYLKDSFSQKIIVPFCFQSQKSNINIQKVHDIVWYKKQVFLNKDFKEKNIILHFGAVDYEMTLYVNGNIVGTHIGGHSSFKFDITSFVNLAQENDITIRVFDNTYDLTIPRGKQYWKEKSESIFYTRTTGIWQTVWIECLNKNYVDKVRFTPDIDNDIINIEYFVNQLSDNMQIKLEILFNEKLVNKVLSNVLNTSDKIAVKLNDFNFHDGGKLWSPERPNLYDVKITLTVDENVVDEVDSYFGMRKIAVEGNQLFLNNRPYTFKLALDQGYYPNTLLTSCDDNDIIKDVKLAKNLGFNGVRKHQKIEEERYLYYADKLGLLVWEEMPSPHEFSNLMVNRIMNEWQEVLERDYNHPSIVALVPINESWGVPNLIGQQCHRDLVNGLYYLTKSLDETRLVISNDGWEHGKSDIFTIHDYDANPETITSRYSTIENIVNSKPGHRHLFNKGHEYEGQPILISEYGGVSFKVSDWEGWGYSGANSKEDFVEKYDKITNAFMDSPNVIGYCYTQLYDVEQEINGIATYDRELKVDSLLIKEINDKIK